eukprot:6182107-Pleurochrysis_carterae.AAC.2
MLWRVLALCSTLRPQSRPVSACMLLLLRRRWRGMQNYRWSFGGPHLLRPESLFEILPLAAGGDRRRSRGSQAAVRGVLLLGIPVILHLVMLDLHLRLLPRTGNGDGYMSAAFQACIVRLRSCELPAHVSLSLQRTRSTFAQRVRCVFG